MISPNSIAKKTRHPLVPVLACALLNTLWAQPAWAVTDDHITEALSAATAGNWAIAREAVRNTEPITSVIVDWLYLKNPNSQPSFNEARHFLLHHPDWPDQKAIRLKAEAALLNDAIAKEAVQEWFAKYPPISGRGKMALALALPPDAPQRAQLVSEGWVDGDFDKNQYQRVRAKFANMLTTTLHIKRVDRLLWEDKISQAEWLIPSLPEVQQKIASARIALIRNAPDAVSKLDTLGKYANDPGIQYDRMRWRDRKGQEDGVVDILANTSLTPPFPEQWWPYRARYARDLVEKRQYALAGRILERHGELDDASDLSDALWLYGWVKLEFLKDPRTAYRQFNRMYDEVKFPVSKSRAAYWAGRAADANGNHDIAKQWYALGDDYPTTFYGQLSHEAYAGSQPLRFSEPTGSADMHYVNSELVPAIRLLLRNDYEDTAAKLYLHMAKEAETPEQMNALIKIGRNLKKQVFTVKAAKEALRKNLVMLKDGWPVMTLPDNLAIEPAFTLAIARQESEFDREARSSADARGLMQILPSTASHVAGEKIAPHALYQPDLNLRIGSQYLSELVDKYDGSYIMAIAAYNAGPGRVMQWKKRFGTPGKTPAQAIDWIEKIPFQETRNYVQRVIENLQVYRQLAAAEGKSVPSSVSSDITR